MLHSPFLFLLALAGVLCPAIPASAEPEIRLTPREAVRRALRYNLGMKGDRLDPDLTTADERAEAAAFHPELFSTTDVSRSPGKVSAQRAGLPTATTTSVGGELGLRKLFSIGTTVEGYLSTTALYGGGSKGGYDPAYQSGITLSVRQSLLQGISRRANEAALTNARLTRQGAEATLERVAELLAAKTLKAYWDLRAAMAKVAIEEIALKTTEQTLAETKELITAGKLAASELASASYAVQVQRRAKLETEEEVSDLRDTMARLIGLVPARSLATPAIVPVSSPRRTPPKFTLGDLQRKALSQRGDYRALLLATKILRTTEHAAKHLLLPKLDLVGAMDITGLSGEPGSSTTTTTASDEESTGYWSSYAMKRVGWSTGLELEIPLGNAEARADHEIAQLNVKRALLAEEEAVQDLSLELNLAWRAVRAAREKLRLTEEAARVAETKLANETARFKAGKITAHILGTVQAETVAERLAREQALADLVKAVVDLQSAGGVLLVRLKLRPDGKEVRR